MPSISILLYNCENSVCCCWCCWWRWCWWPADSVFAPSNPTESAPAALAGLCSAAAALTYPPPTVCFLHVPFFFEHPSQVRERGQQISTPFLPPPSIHLHRQWPWRACFFAATSLDVAGWGIGFRPGYILAKWQAVPHNQQCGVLHSTTTKIFLSLHTRLSGIFWNFVLSKITWTEMSPAGTSALLSILLSSSIRPYKAKVLTWSFLISMDTPCEVTLVRRVLMYLVCNRSVFVTKMLPANCFASSSEASSISNIAFERLAKIFGAIFRHFSASSTASLLTPTNFQVLTSDVIR